MTGLERGMQMQLFVGPTLPVPACYDVMSAFVSAEVTDSGAERNAFTLTFTLGRSLLGDYALLRDDVFAARRRVVVAVSFGARVEVLIDGLVTYHQVLPGSRPGEARLAVSGEDLSMLLDLEERSDTFPNQSDADIARGILRRYVADGVRADVHDPDIRPSDTQRVFSQQHSDLATLVALARRNTGFVFYIEPGDVPGQCVAYWGPERRVDLSNAQPALTVDMGPWTNVDSISFDMNALGPVATEANRLDPDSRATEATTRMLPTAPNLARRPLEELRTVVDRRAALRPPDVARVALGAATVRNADAVTASGEVDAARYGGVLRARQLVGVRGVGDSFGGLYYVRSVRHTLSPGSYRMSFTLAREGVGSTVALVTV